MRTNTKRNRETFHACNLTLMEGRAPAALADLPAPDAVFIGGTKGGMEAVVDTVLARNPNARICISAIALETLSAAVAALTAHGLAAEVTQIAVSLALGVRLIDIYKKGQRPRSLQPFFIYSRKKVRLIRFPDRNLRTGNYF